MNVFVFLGPSLPVEEARRELGAAVFLPPARRGDVYRLVRDERPAVIGIVDGLFDSVPAVVHKEILFALSRGVRVLGAASMGALRAAELWQFGMEGVGRIFERYRSGEWEDDDEVAVVHGTEEAGFVATSVAMATIRFAVAQARDRDIISAHTADVLTASAKERFYADRSWSSLHEAGLPERELVALHDFIAEERPDAKRDDAVALLRRIRDLVATDAVPPTHDFDFEPTIYWERLTAEADSLVDTRGGGSTGVANSELFRHVRVRPDGQDHLRGAALLHLLDHYAATRGLEPSEEDEKAALARFRRHRGLLSTTQTRQWLDAQHLTEDELRLLIRLELALEAVFDRSDRAVRTLLPLELKRRGEFDRAVAAVVEKKQVVERLGVRNMTLEDAGISFTGLLDWYQSRSGSLHGSIKEHAEQLGFDSPRELLSELLVEYMTDTERR